MDIATIVEEADVGLSADGFDNFLLYEEGAEELQEYQSALNQIGAVKCAKVIADLLAWVTSDPNRTTLEMLEFDKERATTLWERYNAASLEEKPIERAKEAAPKKKPKMPVTDRDYYEYFGEEDSTKPCRKEGCSRGSVKFSVFCRTHHFESVKKKPCPWTD